MLDQNFFNTIFVIPILNILLLFYKFFSLLKIPGALGFSIIGLTLFIVLLLYPLTKKQKLIAEKLNELKPELDKLEKKYKNDKVKLQQEQMKLYQQAGINPGLGCLLPFAQFPFFIALYNVLGLFLLDHKGVNVIKNINQVVYFSFLKINEINPWFLGLNLALSPQKSGVWYYLLVPVVTGVLQYFQISLMTPTLQSKTEKKEEKQEKKSETEDFQQAMNVQMKLMMPALIAWFAYTLPVGLALYWNVFSIFNIIQYRKTKVKK